jgi:hypothetical protein
MASDKKTDPMGKSLAEIKAGLSAERRARVEARAAGIMSGTDRHTGSSFDSFLEEEGILDEVRVVAASRIRRAGLLPVEDSCGCIWRDLNLRCREMEFYGRACAVCHE